MAQQAVQGGSAPSRTSLSLRLGKVHTTAAPWPGYLVALVLLDTAAVVAGAVLAQALRFGGLSASGPAPRPFSYWVVLALMTPAWVVALALRGCYERRNLGLGSEEYRRVFDTGIRFIAFAAVAAFALKYDVARGYVVIAIPLATAFTLTLRYGARRWLHRQRGRGRFMKRVLVVGSECSTVDVIRRLHESPFTGLAVAGACSPAVDGALLVDGRSVPVLGDTDQVFDCAVARGIQTIIVADVTTLPNAELRQLAWQLEGTGIDLMVAPAVTDVYGPRISIRPVADLPLLLLEEPELRGIRRFAKALFDRAAVALALVALTPVLLATAVVIRLTSSGPALFRQVRVGVGGRHFVMLKFRTMVVDAEARLPELRDLNEQSVLFKIRQDPRVTKAGRFLRRWSLDELPQLWNVIRGDMSIVGPRPPLPSEVESYCERARRRLLVKPGITGLWQVSGRAGLPWDEAVRLDLHYVQNWSPSLDAIIIARTVLAVVRGSGAY